MACINGAIHDDGHEWACFIQGCVHSAACGCGWFKTQGIEDKEAGK